MMIHDAAGACLEFQENDESRACELNQPANMYVINQQICI